LKPITIATDGLIDDIDSLVIATRGMIQPAAAAEIRREVVRLLSPIIRLLHLDSYVWK